MFIKRILKIGLVAVMASALTATGQVPNLRLNQINPRRKSLSAVARNLIQLKLKSALRLLSRSARSIAVTPRKKATRLVIARKKVAALANS